MSAETVTINNGGTYEGETVQVVRREADGSLIVKHPTHPRNMLRLKPAYRTSLGVDVEAQWR